MDSMFENERSTEFDLSSISYLNHQMKRLEDFSMLDSPHPKQTSSVRDDRTAREKNTNPRCHSNDHSPERPVSRGGVTVREQEGIIGELKKECFGLKLRIYYMEEQLRENFDANVEDILKENVELKVAVEELKNEITYKTDLLTKASQAMEQMSGDNDGRPQKNYNENVNKIKEHYEGKLKEKDDQLKKFEQEVNELKAELEEHSKKDEDSVGDKDRKYNLLVAQKQQDEDSLKAVICELEQTLAMKEGNIEVLRNDLRRLASNSNPDHNSHQHYKSLCDKLEKSLSEKDSALLQIKSELTCKTNLTDSLQAHVTNLEQALKDTREISEEKESERQKSMKLLQEQYRKLHGNHQSKEKELQTMEKALTEAKEEQLRTSQQKVQFELDSIKTKDSHIIELEIKIKQQYFDLNKSVEEHGRTLKEKDDETEQLKGKYSVVVEEVTRLNMESVRMRREAEEYRSLTCDLKNSLEKIMEKERNTCSQLSELLSKPTTKREELEAVMSNKLIKDLKKQLKDKSVRFQKLEAAKEAADVKNQELLFTIKEKEVVIGEMKKNKGKHIVCTEEQNRKPIEVEVNEIETLKTVELSNNLSKKDQVVDSLTNEIKELKAFLHLIENEKVKLEAECKTVKITKESIDEQLRTAYSQLATKDADAAAREKELIKEMEEISNIFHGVVETYKLLLEKLNNNQHPDIQLRILQHEIAEVESTQGNFQNLFRAILNKLQVNSGNVLSGSILNEIASKDRTLNIQLQESKRRSSLLKGQLYGSTSPVDPDVANRSGEETGDEIRTQFEHEQTVNEKNDEINTLTRKLNQEKQVSELLSQQKNILSQQLESRNTKLEKQVSENVALLDAREKRIAEMQEEISAFQCEMKDLSVKLAKLKADLERSNADLCRRNVELKSAENDVASLKSELSANVDAASSERNALKKDLKELYEMNVRLKKKTKAFEVLVKKKDVEIERQKEAIKAAERKIKELIISSEKGSALDGELQQLRSDYESINEKYSSVTSDNAKFKEKIEELLKINEFHEDTTLQEVKKLGETVETFSQQTSALKRDLQRAQTDAVEKSLEILKLQNQVAKQLKEMNDNLNAKVRLDDALRTQTNKLNEKNREIVDLEAALQKQLAMLNEKASECSKLQDAIQQQLNKNDERVKDVSSLQNILQTQLKEIDEKVVENSRIQTALNEATMENTKLQTELQELHDAFENNKLVDKLTSELIESKSLINSLQSQVSFCSSNHGDLAKLKDEVDRLKHAKMQLKVANRKLMESAEEMSQKLSTSLEEKNMKIEEIKILKTQMMCLEEKIESFSPLYTSSAHNLAVSSSDVFTQTEMNATFDVYEQSDPNSLIIEHINEMKHLRRQLEETISNNDSLRTQLEERLNEVEQDANLLHDPHLRVTLIRDNDVMRAQLHAADANEKRLKLQIEKLKEEKEKASETINTLNSQMHELNVLTTNLKMEMDVYDRLIQQLGINRRKPLNEKDLVELNSTNDLDKNLLLALLEEIRDLRDQLQLTVDVNNQLQDKLEKELGHPVNEALRTPKLSQMMPKSLFSGALLCSLNTNVSVDTSVAQNTQSLADYPSLDETPTKDIGIANTPVGSSLCSFTYSDVKTLKVDTKETFVVLGKSTDFKSLKETVETLVERVSSCVKKLKSSQKENHNSVLKDVAQIRRLVKEIATLLSTLCIFQGKQCGKESNLNSTDTVKCNTNGFDIASKLLKACDTLKTTKGNLQLRNSRPPSRNQSPNH